MTQEVDAYLKADRQWPRHLRIAHARMHWQDAINHLDDEKVRFLQAVLDANGTEIADKKPWRYNYGE